MIFEINMEAFTSTTSTSCSTTDSNKELKRQPITTGTLSKSVRVEMDKALNKTDQHHNWTGVTLSRQTVEEKLLKMISFPALAAIPTRTMIKLPNTILSNVLTKKLLNIGAYV